MAHVPAPAGVLPPAPAAALTGFTDHAAWSSAATTSLTLIDFESIPAGTQVTTNLGSFGIASVTGTSVFETPPGTTTQFVGSSQALPFSMFLPGTLASETHFLSNRMSGDVFATGTITFEFSTPTQAVGAWVADQSPIGGFVIEVLNGATSLGSVTLPPRTSPNSFAGLISDTPFTHATLTSSSTGDSWGLDDLEHGGTSVPAFCSGDGTATACPCGNAGASGNGCASTVSASGAHLAGSGSASMSNDTFVLTGSLMPNSSVLYFQGTSQLNGGAGLVFGDGLRCVAGTILRLGAKTNAGGASSYPGAGDVPISVKGANAAGNLRQYQCWYRNAAPFCTPSTFNLTNGVETTWNP